MAVSSSLLSGFSGVEKALSRPVGVNNLYTSRTEEFFHACAQPLDFPNKTKNPHQKLLVSHSMLPDGHELKALL
jgi:hypothetical protein